jgi:hypothetical protein
MSTPPIPPKEVMSTPPIPPKEVMSTPPIPPTQNPSYFVLQGFFRPVWEVSLYYKGFFGPVVWEDRLSRGHARTRPVQHSGAGVAPRGRIQAKNRVNHPPYR